MEEEKQNNTQENDADALSEIFKIINRYYQEVTITSVKDNCPYGHREGEKFRLTGMNHDCLCGSLYQSIQAPIITLEYGGGVPWEKNPDIFHATCPEMGKVQAEVRRIEQEKPVHLKTRSDLKDMTGKGLPFLDEYRVYLEVIGIERICMWGHKPGERFEVDPFNIGKSCGSLYRAAYPFINLLFTGGSLPWEAEKNAVHGVCPDPYDLLSYRLVREKR
jgi:uncharacterized repeat protein (TIGR04076 family)